MIPSEVTNLFREHCDAIGDVLDERQFTVKRLEDLHGDEVYLCVRSFRAEYKQACFGPAPIAIGKGNRFRCATPDERGEIERREYLKDPIWGPLE